LSHFALTLFVVVMHSHGHKRYYDYHQPAYAAFTHALFRQTMLLGLTYRSQGFGNVEGPEQHEEKSDGARHHNRYPPKDIADAIKYVFHK
jgi:hypothetical protein